MVALSVNATFTASWTVNVAYGPRLQLIGPAGTSSLTCRSRTTVSGGRKAVRGTFTALKEVKVPLGLRTTTEVPRNQHATFALPSNKSFKVAFVAIGTWVERYLGPAKGG